MNETAKTIALERFISDRSKQKLTTTSVELQAFELAFDARPTHYRSEVERLRKIAELLTNISCHHLHHDAPERHSDNEPCPVEAKIKAALSGGKEGKDGK